MDLSPKAGAEKFQCPHCGVVSQQTWFTTGTASSVANRILLDAFYSYRSELSDYQQDAIEGFMKRLIHANDDCMSRFFPDALAVATCSLCNETTLWVDGKIVYPREMPVAQPNGDMASAVQDLYHEAAKIVVDSPKGATALLRLALQLLLQQVGKPGKNINSDIKDLVAEGLSPKIQKALDLLRVVGNNAVHPGLIDLNDNREIAIHLFQVLNFIADEMITKPKELDLLYADVVPDETKGHIAERDRRS